MRAFVEEAGSALSGLQESSTSVLRVLLCYEFFVVLRGRQLNVMVRFAGYCLVGPGTEYKRPGLFLLPVLITFNKFRPEGGHCLPQGRWSNGLA